MEMITQWFSENQGLLLQYVIDFAIAIAIFIVGKWVAKIISKLVAYWHFKRHTQGTYSGNKKSGSLHCYIWLFTCIGANCIGLLPCN